MKHNRVPTPDSNDHALTLGVITNMYPLPGYESFGVFVQSRVEAYRNAGVEVSVVSPRKKSGPTKYLLLLISSLWRLIRRPIPDVYEVHYIAPTGIIGMLIAWIARRPYVLYAHGSDVETVPKSGMYRRLIARSVRSAAEIHTNSDFMVDRIEARWDPDVPVIVLPPGIHVPDRPRLDGRRDIDVLFVGNLNRGKGVDVLIEALAQLNVDRPIRAIIAGEGPEAETLQQQARDSGVEISFPGLITPAGVPELMGRASVVAVPSRHEGLGQVAIEALAQGTPIVVSKVGGLASVPTPACGTLVPPDDARALADALADWIRVVDSDRIGVAQSAHARAGDFEISHLAKASIARLRYVAGLPSRASGNSRPPR